MNRWIVRWRLVAVAAVTFIAFGAVLFTWNDVVSVVSAGGSPAQAQESGQLSTSTTAGQLDASFGTDGKVLTDLTAKPDSAWALAIQADGKIVVAGGEEGVVARYSDAGVLDVGFHGDSRKVADFFFGISGVAIQGDGKIVVAGGAGPRFPGSFALARLTSNGALDRTFGGDGKVSTDFGPRGGYAASLAIQQDGKIVAAGWAEKRGFALARYNRNGTLDRAFGDGGRVITPPRGGAQAVAIQADGKIVVCGWTSAGKGAAVFRYNSDGTLDETFGGDGKVFTALGAFDLAVQPDGRIVVAGAAHVPDLTRPVFALARYASDGTLDVSFGVNGIVTTDVSPQGKATEAGGVAIQADGKIVAAGTAGPYNRSRFVLARYESDGTLDATFGDNGTVTTAFTPRTDGADAVAIQADGRIVAAGYAGWSSGTDMQIALARYLAQ
jgi:uncharacterized delta-60 repeat protein